MEAAASRVEAIIFTVAAFSLFSSRSWSRSSKRNGRWAADRGLQHESRCLWNLHVGEQAAAARDGTSIDPCQDFCDRESTVIREQLPA